MDSTLLEKIGRINARIAKSLCEARDVLRGESRFGVEEIREFQDSLNEMAPILGNSEELRRTQPQISAPLDLYKSQLVEFQLTLDQLHVMLQGQRASLQAGRVQLDAASRWLSTCSNTR